ncbi:MULTISPECIES: SMI1/KNR4 family protein [unclassified Bartonella]|uniref:SMI1/KNR4 family protein n=1 Tax=unclassified Bartonella TaxID=2645622 RepID=UPI002360ED20|nr:MULTISPECIES: SMI1/KNR4 family protein [unclassified Bartonella]
MQTYTLDDVIELVDKVDKYDSDVVSFGTAENAVDDIWIEKAEKALSLQFTSSYKAFLKHYKGGDIGGDEIYSLYEDCVDFPFNDIVCQNLNYYRKRGFATSEQLVVSSTDFGETFYFDYTQFRDGECPLYVMLPSEGCEYYASNFYEFLCKRIKESVGAEIPEGDQPIEKHETPPIPQPIPFYERFWKKIWGK